MGGKVNTVALLGGELEVGCFFSRSRQMFQNLRAFRSRGRRAPAGTFLHLRSWAEPALHQLQGSMIIN